ncbi:MAG: LysM domain-containing protein [Candidatus Nitricoxidivorans perseverans]|uniref:LysM domain-containing protein n=1 Tax=Candidatus Nitricoxidivorans perseverans TaxID=2975601 RepID=A0AA49FJR2_9PROT|nr:MAG: LysM domain-containing protein [Candidatus Nitricoxidivorans perseverans]
MSDPLQALLEAGMLNNSSFPPNSRYHGAAVATLERKNQEPVAYLKRRFVPPPENFSVVQEHAVVEGDRLDNLAARYLGDPELYWRLCDANRAVRPGEITETPGARLAITLPEGVPGASDA